MSNATGITPEVFKQSAPLVDEKLSTGHRALQGALRLNRRASSKRGAAPAQEAMDCQGDTALLMQAALRRQQSTDAVFAACCAGRLDAPSDVFGTLPAGLGRGTIVARAHPLPEGHP